MSLCSPARGYACQRAENKGPSNEPQLTVQAEYIFSPSRGPHLAIEHGGRAEIVGPRQEQKRKTLDGRFRYNLGRNTNLTIGEPEAQNCCFSDRLNHSQRF